VQKVRGCKIWLRGIKEKSRDEREASSYWNDDGTDDDRGLLASLSLVVYTRISRFVCVRKGIT